MSQCDKNSSNFLKALQLADSALPVGSLSHSFGLETLVFDQDLAGDVQKCVAALSDFLEDALAEWLLIDAVCCHEAYGCGLTRSPLTEVNAQMSAIRLAREPREASLAMGRRFARLIHSLQPDLGLSALVELDELHHAAAFGYSFALLGLDSEWTVSAYLQQVLLNLVSAAQRLLPLGQLDANRITWNLKDALLKTARRSATLTLTSVCAFSHLPELASMRHPCLPTRLFIS